MNFNNIPIVTKYLIIINVIVFAFTGFLAPQIGDLFVVRHFQNPDFAPWQVITSMFTHGGFFHLLVNMYGVFLFGSTIERAWGPERFLKVYLLAGLGGTLLHQGIEYFQISSALSALGSDGSVLKEIYDNGYLHGQKYVDPLYQKIYENYMTGAVGASGALFGIVVAFTMLFPNTELMVIPIPIPIKAKILIPLFMAGSLLFGVLNLEGDNIGHFAHLGGAFVGFIFVMIWKKDKTKFY